MLMMMDVEEERTWRTEEKRLDSCSRGRKPGEGI
jgi:hypothetical protein